MSEPGQLSKAGQKVKAAPGRARSSVACRSSSASHRNYEQRLVRLAALVASGAPPISYALNLGVAGKADIDVDEVRGVFAAVAPIVGTARVAAAVGNIVKALALEDLAEIEEESTG